MKLRHAAALALAGTATSVLLMSLALYGWEATKVMALF
jgi:hypothetical protein